jgi:2-polyprenyl-6-methoxyphenol hydroxylase-like FAD-dependent oxidoreductase
MGDNTIGNHAVVLGAGMAGLLAARVLADAYHRVTVVERDELHATAEPRRGVPQGRHIHGLLGRGQQALDELFGGFTDDLTASGVPTVDQLGDARLYFSGHRLRQATSGLVVLSASRPCLEAHVRARVRSLPRVTFADQRDVLGLVSSPDRDRVIGARLIPRADGGTEETVHADLAGFLDFAKSLQITDVYDAIVDAESLDELVGFSFPASVRRRYERMRRFPVGLLVIGDGICSLNPIYGQGMSVAAIEALTLRERLKCDREPRPRKVLRDFAKAINAPWGMTIGADLAFPAVDGRRNGKVRMANAYVPRLHAAAAHDAAVATEFLRVAGLLERPEALFRPDVVVRVLKHSLRNRATGRQGDRRPDKHVAEGH